MKTEFRGFPRISLAGAPGELFNSPHGSFSGALKSCPGSLDGTCTEKLLLHCAAALESNDATHAQQVMWVLNNVAAAAGDPNQRLASWFLRALVARASRLYPHAAAFRGSAAAVSTRPMSVTELAAYVDLLPWHRFGFSAANGAICAAARASQRIHILDLSITHCMQWPTLIDELAKRKRPDGGPPSLRITVPAVRPPVSPLLNVSIEEVGLRLANFAQSRQVPFEFHVLRPRCNGAGGAAQTDPPRFPFQFLSYHFDPSLLDVRDDETLVVNCQNWIRYLPAEGDREASSKLLTKDGFLEAIRGLNPAVVTVADEDADLDSPSLSSRITACFNYLWIPFDALETFLPNVDSPQRREQEAAVGQKIENVVGFEGRRRIERAEPGGKVARRMRRAGFCGAAFGEETVKEVRVLLEEHAGGWGMKREDDMLVLTWKGHSSVFVSAWSPAGFHKL